LSAATLPSPLAGNPSAPDKPAHTQGIPEESSTAISNREQASNVVCTGPDDFGPLTGAGEENGSHGKEVKINKDEETSINLWDEAYKNIKRDHKELVDAYEKVLSAQREAQRKAKEAQRAAQSAFPAPKNVQVSFLTGNRFFRR
jgi:hypothetical protein